ncbi:hypothetical protein AA12717_0546 [Gluconacetobacter sacchari DSM 12717]|nr:hypothetical protein [Gluconacetobacter sacchari]GBQ20357.1 hypothetical protein AA12717_0546 [Gluconacetobacter sacchari DSM 12717]
MTAAGISRRRADLPELERTVLWCIRAWVISLSDRRDYAEGIENVFHQLGVGAAIADLHGLMVTTGRGARRVIEVNCVCFPYVSADERLLLDALACQQRGRHEDAFDILTGLMTDAAALDGCDHLARMALTFAAAGHVFEAPRGAPWWPGGEQGWSSSIPATTLH